jgi:hypothetical protein
LGECEQGQQKSDSGLTLPSAKRHQGCGHTHTRHARMQKNLPNDDLD